MKPDPEDLLAENRELRQRHSSLRQNHDNAIVRIDCLEGSLLTLAERLKEANQRLEETNRRLEEHSCPPPPPGIGERLAALGRTIDAALPTRLLREAALVERSGLFDAAFYLRTYPDVAASGVSPLRHYLRIGWREHRDPHPLFDTARYLEWNQDTTASGMSPLTHFIRHGSKEGRDPASSFRLGDYLARHPDLGDENPILHFLRRGFTRPEECAVSIVIPRFGQPDLTLRCLAALACLRDETTHEIIVVDDCSPEETPLAVNDLPGVVHIRQPENRGFVAACNTGAARARGEFLVFLNNDTEVRNGWLDNLRRTFDDFPDAGLAGSKLLYPDGRLQEAGGVIWRDGTGCNYGRGDDPARPEYNFVREADYCSGASIMVPTALFRALGGFSEEYAPAYFEDTDLSFRVRHTGRKVYYQPFSEVVHLEGATCGRDESCGMKQYQARNRQTFVTRWRGELAAHPTTMDWPFPLASVSRVPRVLVVDTWVPTPDQDSGSVRMRHLLKALQRLGYAVTFMPQNARHNGRYTEELQRLGIECLYRPQYRTLHHMLTERAAEFDFFWIARHNHLQEGYDTIRRLAPDARVVLDTIDLHFLRLERLAALSGRRADRRLAARTRRDELGFAAVSDAVVVVSSVERDLLSGLLPGQKVHVISNAHRLPPEPQGFDGRRDALFVGGFNHPPNVDAVRWLVEEIWPLVVARRPEARLYVVGDNPPGWLTHLTWPGVEALGHVPDLAPWYARVALSVAPLRYGAGVKGKIGESMAHGVPVVTTAVGAEGMSAVDGRTMLVADTAPAFAEAILRVMGDAGLWRVLSTEGRLAIDRDLSPMALQRNLELLLGWLGPIPS